MKKIIYTAVIALGAIGFTNAQATTPVAANTEASVEVKAESLLQEKYVEIKATDLTQEVQTALSKDFEGATLNKAYINSKNEYKLTLTTAEDTEATVYATAEGEWIKKK